MTRWVVLFALAACSARAPLPRWSDPLVRSPRDALPARPEPAPIEPPTFPGVEAISVPDESPSLVLRRSEGPFVTIAVATRRGDDGGCDDGLLPFAMRLLAHDLRRELGEAAVGMSVGLHGAALSVELPRGELERGMRALHRAITGTISPSLLERVKVESLSTVERWKDQAYISTMLSAVDRLHGFRRGSTASVEERVERIERVTLQSIRDCRTERFAPSDTLVVVRGDVSASVVAHAYQVTFADMRGDIPRRAAHRFGHVTPDVAAISKPTGANQAHALFLRRAPPPMHPDRLAFEMLVEILGGSFSSRLNGSLRETHAYTYGTFGRILDDEYSDVLHIQAAFRSEDVADAVQGLFDHMRRIRTERITPEELVLARNRVWIGAARRSDVGLIVRAWQIGLTLREWERRHRVLENITPEQLQTVARRQFDPHGGVFVLTGDFSAIAGVWVQRNNTGFHLRRN